MSEIIKQPLDCASLPSPEPAPSPLLNEYHSMLAGSLQPNSNITREEIWSRDHDKINRTILEGNGVSITAWAGHGTEQNPETLFSTKNIPGGHQEDHYRYDAENHGERQNVTWAVDYKNGGINLTGVIKGHENLTEETGTVFDNNNHLLEIVKYTFNPDGQVTSCASQPDYDHPASVLWTEKVS